MTFRGGLGTFEEDAYEDSSSFQSTAEAKEEGALAQGEEDASYAYAYECDPGDEEESNGFQWLPVCGKLWGPCIPPDEAQRLDDNCDGEIDEDSPISAEVADWSPLRCVTVSTMTAMGRSTKA